MSTPVTIFNVHTTSIQVRVNDGSPIFIEAAGAAQKWIPQQPTSNAPIYNRYPEDRGEFVNGNNLVTIVFPDGRSEQIVVQIQVSRPPSLQLYIFDPLSWVLLSDGKMIASYFR